FKMGYPATHHVPLKNIRIIQSEIKNIVENDINKIMKKIVPEYMEKMRDFYDLRIKTNDDTKPLIDKTKLKDQIINHKADEMISDIDSLINQVRT
ncbi:hypothetical protein KY334_05355, partial [Candidatus Woesearchaeota archaeon]|nr:hypothetical protein [Candidatus Woesearchaeota archaeon]